MEILHMLEKMAKRKRKKIRIPSEKEYYAAYEKIETDGPVMNEKDRRAARMLKKNPPAYELMKKLGKRSTPETVTADHLAAHSFSTTSHNHTTSFYPYSPAPV